MSNYMPNINMLKASAVLALVVHAIAGAQSVVPEPAPVNGPAIATQATPSCCEPLSTLTKTVLPKEKTEFNLNEKSLVHDFGQGPQPYLLIELPSFTKTYSIGIADLPQLPGLFNKTSYTQLALQIQTLDAEFIVKRDYSYSGMKKRGLGYEKTVFINPTNSSEKYILVRGVLNVSPQDVTVSKTDIVFVGTGYFIGGADTKLTLLPIGMGVLVVDVKN
jgi:hypothetical protein